MDDPSVPFKLNASTISELMSALKYIERSNNGLRVQRESDEKNLALLSSYWLQANLIMTGGRVDRLISAEETS